MIVTETITTERMFFLDIETTGLIQEPKEGEKFRNDSRQPDVLEIYISSPRYGRCHQYIETEKEIPAEITALTGITNETISEKGVKFSEAMDSIMDLVTKYPTTPIVYWNADFDTRVILKQAERLGYPLYKALFLKNRAFCLMKYVTEHYPEIPRRHAGENKYVRLIDAHKFFFPDGCTEQRHNAIDDVGLMMGVYRAVFNDVFSLQKK